MKNNSKKGIMEIYSQDQIIGNKTYLNTIELTLENLFNEDYVTIKLIRFLKKDNRLYLKVPFWKYSTRAYLKNCFKDRQARRISLGIDVIVEDIIDVMRDRGMIGVTPVDELLNKIKIAFENKISEESDNDR